MVVAGGAAGGAADGYGGTGAAGGGAGGFRESPGSMQQILIQLRPLNATSGPTYSFTSFCNRSYPITVGAAEHLLKLLQLVLVQVLDLMEVSNSTFSTITSTGGGGGRRWKWWS